SASEGYEDALGDGKMWQLLRFIRQQERSYLGGAGTTASNGALQITTTNTPTAALSTLNGPANQTNLPTGSYGFVYAVALNYRAVTNPNNTVALGITTQYLRTNADSSTDLINGGTGIVSLVSGKFGPTVAVSAPT